MAQLTIELSMIVKDEATSLARCLRSVQGAVDRILIGDTGSSDNTVEIARSFGAEIVHVPWNNDFSQARNALLERATCDWVLVLDADEMLDAQGPAQLRRDVQAAGIDAYDVHRWNYVRERNSRSGENGSVPNPGALPESLDYPSYVLATNTRLFRRDPRVYFERPVHETVIHRLQQLGRHVGVASFPIHHLGQAEDSVAKRAKKNETYQQIGRLHLTQHPDDSRTCFELGLGELEHFKNPQAALQHFSQAIALDPGNAPAHIMAGVCLVRLKEHARAIAALEQAKALDPTSIVLHEALGDAFYLSANYGAAHTAYQRALQLGSDSSLVVAKTGSCRIYLGDTPGGVALLEKALHADLEQPELLDVVALGFALAREHYRAAKVARQRLSLGNTTDFHHELAATLERLCHDIDTGGSRGLQAPE